MVFPIFLGIRAVKYARKSYKKHQAEKEMNLRSDRPAIVDPSNELLASNRYSQDAYQTQQAPYDYRQPTSQKSRRSSNSSFMSEASRAEFEAELENDPEFRRFVEEQQRMYRSFQQQSRRSSRSVSNIGSSSSSSSYTDSLQPPTYDSVMAQSKPVDVRQYPQSHLSAQDGGSWSRMAARVASHTS